MNSFMFCKNRESNEKLKLLEKMLIAWPMLSEYIIKMVFNHLPCTLLFQIKKESWILSINYWEAVEKF